MKTCNKKKQQPDFEFIRIYRYGVILPSIRAFARLGRGYMPKALGRGDGQIYHICRDGAELAPLWGRAPSGRARGRSDKNAIDAIADRRPLMASIFASDTMR
jgi:hypothetical protein